MKTIRKNIFCYAVVISVLSLIGCQNISSKKNMNSDLLNHWVHYSEMDRGDTLVFVHDQNLKTVRGGRINFKLFDENKVVYEEQGNNDMPISKSGIWECDSNKNTLTFKLENTTIKFLILSLKNNRLEIKQTSM